MNRDKDDLDHFKAECSLCLSMRHSKFLDECSNILFVLSYMKGGTTGPWATQRINSILYPSEAEEVTWAGVVSELYKMFEDPNCQAPARRKLTTLHQGDSSVEELIQEFKIHGPISRLCNRGHIAKVCEGPHAQNVQNVDATMILRLAPKDLQFLTESLRATVTPSVPMTPLPESEGEKTPGDEGF